MLSDIRVFYDSGWWKLEYSQTGLTTIIYLVQGIKNKHTREAAFEKAESHLTTKDKNWRGEEKQDE